MNDSIIKPFIVRQKDTSGTGKFLIGTPPPPPPNLSCTCKAQVDSIQCLLQIHHEFRISYPYHSSHLEPITTVVNGHRTDTPSCIQNGAKK